MSPSGNCQTLSVTKKSAVVEEHDSGVKSTLLAVKNGITKSVLTTILEAKDKLRSSAGRFAPDRKRPREVVCSELEKAVILRLKHARSSNLPISERSLCEKAEELSVRFGIMFQLQQWLNLSLQLVTRPCFQSSEW